MTTLAPTAPPVGAFPMPDVGGVEHEYVEVDGVRLHLATAGDPEGEPLFLVHGWPQHWWSWRELIGPLAAEGYRVIAPDIRGMGWSDAPRRGYGFTDFAAEFLRLLDVLNLQRVKFVGHDWGLGVGCTVALQNPERIERMVLMGGPHFWSAKGPPASLYVRVGHIWLNGSPLGNLATTRLHVPELCLRYWRSAGAFTREEVEIYTAPLRRPSSANATVQRYRTFSLKELRYFRTEIYEQRLRVPTLHLNGGDDPLCKGIGDQWRHHTDDMRYELVPGVGHFLHEEAPAYALDRITAFMQTGPTARQAGGNGVAPSGRRPSITTAR